MTKMWAGRKNGSVFSGGRCDAKCHNAKRPSCHCLCNGLYHGASRIDGGMEQADQRSLEAIEHGQRIAKEQGWELHVPEPTLFEEVVT